MFLLYVDETVPPRQRPMVRQARMLFAPVFQSIADIEFVDSPQQVREMLAAYGPHEDCLIIPFGAGSAAKAASQGFCLPILLPGDDTSILENANAPAALRVGAVPDLRAYVLNEPLTTTWHADGSGPFRPVRQDPEGDKRVHQVNWPIWDLELINHLRFKGAAEKTQTIARDDVLFDSHGASHGTGEITITGVIFGACLDTSQGLDDVRPVLDRFIHVFQHNEDAFLRVYITSITGDETPVAPIARQLNDYMRRAGPRSCRIIVTDARHALVRPAELFNPTSFYITSESLWDIYAATGYFAALTPLLLPHSQLGAFGLWRKYPLAITGEACFETILKNAFHIARTAPDGYRELRRAAMNTGRDHFSVAAATTMVRRVLREPGYEKATPGIDWALNKETLWVMYVGLRDMKVNGWFDYETRSIARDFAIDTDDVVVDVGCGSGAFSRFAAAFGREVIYCDVNPDTLQTAGQHIEEAARCPTRGILTNGETLDIESGYADKIVCTEVLEHVDDPTQVMRELVRIGKPGSLYLISVPDTLSENLQKHLAPPQYFEKPNHIRIFERDVFVSLIESAGLQILRREYWGFYSVFDWVLHWFDDPELDVMWAKLWTRLLDGKRGMATKRVLDQNIAKSQSIIARKPAGS